MDLCITHDRSGSSSNPLLHDTLHYPDACDIDKPLNEATFDKIRDQSSISFMSSVVNTSGEWNLLVILLWSHISSSAFIGTQK